MLGKGQLSECYSTECSRGSNYKSERCILFEVREICFLVLEYVHQRLVIFGMFLVNTKRQKESLCVHGTGRRWDGVLISTRTTFRQLDFNQPLIPRKPAHRNSLPRTEDSEGSVVSRFNTDSTEQWVWCLVHM